MGGSPDDYSGRGRGCWGGGATGVVEDGRRPRNQNQGSEDRESLPGFGGRMLVRTERNFRRSPTVVDALEESGTVVEGGHK